MSPPRGPVVLALARIPSQNSPVRYTLNFGCEFGYASAHPP